MLNQGVGVTGLNRPVFWGAYMVNFVFFIGISHAGIMISAILRLTQAEWRRPVTRAAEVLTVFSLMSALMAAPLVHVGRPWRADLWCSRTTSPAASGSTSGPRSSGIRVP